MSLRLTPSAATRVKALCSENNATFVRVSVEGGGCQGFQYVFGFDDIEGDDDLVVELDGGKVLVDAMSQPFLEDATLDFIDDLSGAHFKISNPVATSACGCGTSFSL